MAYQALYRKWRPLVFEDIVGQEHITRTLKNQIVSGKIGHAYLFCGTRGTGKTTAAKIFARAVNCLDNDGGSPCNRCEICRGILDGSIMDVSEIDAASNNGVENIRGIREEVAYTAASARYRVYIIDEVHMLSSGAFNALLKTLEEPPEHVIFILATTESHKIPQTIMSRCQRFDFKRIKPSDIILRMKEIALKDNISITDDAYELLAKLADGSLRDGLSVLERCTATYPDGLSAKKIMDVLGITPSEIVYDISDAVSRADINAALSGLNDVAAEGRDLNVFADSLISHFRDLLVCKVSGNADGLLDYSSEDIVRIKSRADKLTFEKISNIISLLAQARADAKWLKNPRVVYELCFVKMCRPELDDSKDALLDRISTMEEKIKNGITVKNVQTEEKKEKKAEKPKTKTEGARLFKPIEKSALTADNPVVVAAKKWDKILQALKKSATYVAPHCTNRKITIDRDGIIIIFEDANAMAKTLTDTYIKKVEETAKQVCGTDIQVKTAFRKDVEDMIVDFWNIGEDEPEEIIAEADPIDELAAAFPEIVEFTDDSEFVNYNSSGQSFEQGAISDSHQDDDDYNFEDD